MKASRTSVPSARPRARLRKSLGPLFINSYVGGAISLLYGDVLTVKGFRIWLPEEVVPRRIVAAMKLGSYERSEVEMLRKWLEPGTPVVELGVGIGWAAVHVRYFQGTEPSACYLGVEADSRARAIAAVNLAANVSGLGPPSRIVEGIIGCRGEPEASSVESERRRQWGPAQQAQDVKTQNDSLQPLMLRDLLVKHRHPQRGVLVCDIEGAERQLVSREADSLGWFDTIIMEMHEPKREGGTPLRVEDVASLIAAEGLDFVDSHGRVFVFVRRRRCVSR